MTPAQNYTELIQVLSGQILHKLNIATSKLSTHSVNILKATFWNILKTDSNEIKITNLKKHYKKITNIKNITNIKICIKWFKKKLFLSDCKIILTQLRARRTLSK